MHQEDLILIFCIHYAERKEPVYEYDFPKPYLADQKFFPLKQPFNLYMDKHRDQKQVNKEYLERKLAKTHPFEGPEQPLRFPNAHPIAEGVALGAAEEAAGAPEGPADQQTTGAAGAQQQA